MEYSRSRGTILPRSTFLVPFQLCQNSGVSFIAVKATNYDRMHQLKLIKCASDLWTLQPSRRMHEWKPVQNRAGNEQVSKQLYSRAEYWYGKMFLDVF